LPRGSYEVTVTQKSKSAFAIASSRGFLRKTSVAPQLAPQPARRFVGDSPAGCMYYANSLLYSYGCAGADIITIHKPATTNQPTYNLKNKGYIGTIEGIVNLPSGVVALAQKPVGGDSGDGSGNQHVAYLLDINATANSGTALTTLKNNDSYSILPYRQGFLAYNEAFTDFEYYSSVTAKPQKISIAKPQASDQKPLSIAAAGSNILVAYSNKADYENNTDAGGIGKVKSEMFLYNQNRTINFSLGSQFKNIKLCGSQKLCALDTESKVLHVYDISADKPDLLYKINGVQDIEANGSRLLALRSDDLLSLDVAAARGFESYDFSNYGSCGLQANGSAYLLCLSDKTSGQSSVVYIDPATVDSDDIDTKLFAIRNAPDVKEASVYGKYIFISPELGDVDYYASLGGFGYNPAVQAKAKTNIDNLIKSLDLKNNYVVTVNGL
jgi:hypothetical protein